MNSELALRVAVAGSIALLMFAVIFLRLWFLQVLTGSQYVAEAKTNVVRKVPVAAPRGSILASDGTPLVESVKVPAVSIEPQQLPVPLAATKAGLINQPAKDYVVYDNLAKALGMSTRPSKCTFHVTLQDPSTGKYVPETFSPYLAEIPCIIAQNATQITVGSVTIATDIPVAEQAYISEHENLDQNGVDPFQGVQVGQVSVSQYPQGELAAQVLGTVGANVNAATGGALFQDVEPYDKVGNTGLEYQYNQDLQGKDGAERVEVNAQGVYEGETTPVAPTAGYDLKTSLNVALEKVGDQALATSISDNGNVDNGGAFLAMNPTNGQIYAMGSEPSYNPADFDKPLTQAQYDQLFGDNPGDPLLNRAIQSVGLDGSTFKVITGTAALESGAWSPGKIYDDTGSVTVSGQLFHNAPGDGAQGDIDMEQAYEVSDDDFFYNLGYRMNPDPTTQPQGSALQEWARKFGVGQRPDIDLPYAEGGTVPTPKLIEDQIEAEHECDTATGAYAYTNGQGGISSKPRAGYHRSPTHPAGGCGIADASTVGWTVGDNMLAAIGQGDVQVSPLQLAMVYAAIENGGTLVSPHVGEDIQSADGQVVQQINPAPERKLGIDPVNLQTIQEGLRLAASGPSGTSADVMGSFPLPVYGKTGTADYEPTTGPDAGTDIASAWYACYVPASATSKPILVVVWVPGGGYGDVAAAPVARQILSQWFYGKPGTYVTGSSKSQ